MANPLNAAKQSAASLQCVADVNSGQDAATALIAHASGLQPDANNTGQLPQGERVGGK